MPLPSLTNQRVLVQGLGRFGGGVGVTRWLASQGAHVTVTDIDTPENLRASLDQLAGLPVTFKLGGHDLADFTHTDLLVTNPAVDKVKSEHVQAARHAGIPITTELNLFLQRCCAFTVGITGSVGKSTTTMLTYLAIQAAIENQKSKIENAPVVFLGGNIGKSLLLDLPQIRPQDIVVLEISSFMLEDTPAIAVGGVGGQVGWSPNIAVVTNLFPNHLDRHHTMAEYAAAKQNILAFQKPADVAIFNADDALVSRWAHLARGPVAKYTLRGPRDQWIPLLIPGAHNQSNAQAALAVLDRLPLHVNIAAARQAMAEFTGLPHRLELVHTAHIDGRELRFYNDSKATSPDASATALDAFEPGTTIFIVGGYDKHIDLAAFETLLARRAGGVIGIGATGPAIIASVQAKNPAAARHVASAQTLENAVPLALQWARTLPAISAVALSPASASWGQFKNYEERGELFTRLARQLAT